jgi:photosystem II stability/assembly factor-like uncharacterized protein
VINRSQGVIFQGNLSRRFKHFLKKTFILLMIGCVLTLAINTPVTQAKTVQGDASSMMNGLDIMNSQGWKSIGPGGGGWLTALAFSPPNTILAGCDVGGVYRSDDWGYTWQIVNDGLTNYNVNAILVDPLDANMLYLGTLGGVFISIDRGGTWAAKRNGFPGTSLWSFSAPISTIALAPVANQGQPRVIYAGIGDSHAHRFGSGTIYKSVDSGDSWFVVNTDPYHNLAFNALVYSIVVDPTNPDHLFAATDKGFYQSEDAGVSWQPSNTGLPHTNTRQVVMHPTDSNILYLTIHATPNQVPWQGGVYKSINGGDTWVAMNTGLSQFVGNPTIPDPALITSNYEQLVIDPHNPNVLYLGDISWTTAGVYKSMDGGNHWNKTVNPTSLHPGNFIGVGPSVECLLLIPTLPGMVYFGTPMELYLSEDSGTNWRQVDSDETPGGSGYWRGRGLETTSLYDIAVDPVDSNRVYFGFYDIGFQKSLDGGVTFKHAGHELQYWRLFFKIVIDPASPNILYASTGDRIHGQLAKSADYGETWYPIGTPGSGSCCIYSLVIDPTSQTGMRTLYAGSHSEGVFKSIDGGATWVEKNIGLGENGNRSISSLVIDPTNPNVLYAGLDMQGMPSDQYGGVYKTVDGGDHWAKAGSDLPNVRDIVIDPVNSQNVYAAVRYHFDQVNQLPFAGGVYKSSDGGVNWIKVFSDIFVNKVEAVLDLSGNPILLAGTADHPFHDESSGHGVFLSLDNGASWQPMNTGLEMLSVFALASDPQNPNVVYVGTGGGGIFKWDSTNQNHPPNFTSSPVQEVFQNSPYSYFIIASDPDWLVGTDLLTISAVVKPDWLTLIDHGNGTATLSGTPNVTNLGGFPVVLQVMDQYGSLTTQSFILTVRENIVYLPLIIRGG